mmetsp:Transcript_20955/g.34608  ORF Transcript_20955/g.34608 Transcript_20955/m.34608 type:complete len:126 (-) Transcript_20955:978-1355(-)
MQDARFALLATMSGSVDFPSMSYGRLATALRQRSSIVDCSSFGQSPGHGSASRFSSPSPGLAQLDKDNLPQLRHTTVELHGQLHTSKKAGRLSLLPRGCNHLVRWHEPGRWHEAQSAARPTCSDL